jgi:sugar-specific transcriptional regulator TrmB
MAIVELGQPTAKSIAQTLQIARAEIYRATTELQKLGLTKKIISAPIAFKAVPLPEALSILLQQKAEKHKEIQAKAEQFLQNYQNHNKEKPSQENARYYLTSGERAEEREFVRNLAETQTSMDCILEWKVVVHVVNKHFEELKEALERGVKIRYITYIPEGEKIPENVQTLTKTGSFQVKSASTTQKAGIDVVDKKLVRLITFPNANLKEIEVLRLNHLEIVDLAQEYFELKWQSATTP